ncbi:MAG: DUF721 domain-containing protein [Planctomycetes bacterium]|nr:DUF721 domain-containing protein [Planctomycetota bacterium]
MSGSDPKEGKRRGGAPRRLGDILSSVLQKRAWARPMMAAGLQEAWERAAGTRLAGRTRVAQFRDGILTIEVASSTLRYELEAFSGAGLLARLQQDPAAPRVTRLQFRVGSTTA